MDTRTTQTTLNEEKNQSSSRVRTQGELWDEILAEGYDAPADREAVDRLYKLAFGEKKTTVSTAPTAPIIDDGKTLDELVKGDKLGESLTRELRSRGETDQEIWQFMIEN